MQAVNLYIRANQQDYADDEAKILFALSYMTEGLPAQWAKNFVAEADNRDDESFGTWAAFKTSLKSSFENKNKRKDALAKLQALKQGTQTAEEFFQRFDLVRREAEVTDQNQLIDLVERAISREILTQIYSRGEALPTTYEDWKTKVIELDALQRRLKAITSSTNTWRPTQQTQSRPLPTPPNQQPAIPTPPQNQWAPGSGTTYGGLGKPMDLDAAKAKGVCYKCAQRGHIGKFCPNRKAPAQARQQVQGTPFDVRKFSYEEMKKFATDWREADEERRKKEDERTEFLKGF